MRRLRRVGAAMAVILTGVVIGGLSSTSVAQTQVQVLEFPGPYARDVDLAKTGFGPGDMHLEISDLLDPVDENVLGRSILKGIIVRLHNRGEDWTFILDVTAQLPDGDIVFYGGGRYSELVSESGTTLSVTGGTGAFAGASGTVTIVPAEVAGEQGFMWTFDLITP